jgi:tRNA pseudouridine13 synthase
VLTFTPSVETFVVEEVPAYLPSGEGEHTYLWIEKTDLTTFEAVRRLARAFDVDPRDIGYAGMKDRHATTRQWLSVPRLDPARALELSQQLSQEPSQEPSQDRSSGGLRVLDARRHGNKLRTGHLHGNRFEVVFTGADETDAQRLAARLDGLARDGLANRYGDQRFGATGENAAQGLAILRGERRERDHRRRKLLLSSVQSAVFNRYLELRREPAGDARALHRVRLGDVLQKTGSGGLFVCTEVAIDQARVDAGELVPTGPMPGTRVMEPPPDSEAGQLEQRALEASGATRDDFARAGRDLPGARRPVIVNLELGVPALTVEPAAGALRVRFGLPAGSYATVVIDCLLTSVAASVDAKKSC